MSAPVLEDDLFARTREACAEVARCARFVRIDDMGVERLASILARERPPPPELDPAHQQLRDEKSTIAFIVTLNAINFGSGWFPHLDKDPGKSGYRTVAGRLRRHFEANGPLRPGELAKIDAAGCAAILGQGLAAPIDELMQLFAQSWNDLGRWLIDRHRQRFEGPIEQAGGSAARLVAAFAEMPLYRDESLYRGFRVPFYKRAQITCADLALALRGRGLGAFRDLDELTIFADNLVPHVLRMLGVLKLELMLLARIDAGTLLEHGSEEEVELRAVALHAVELLVASCGDRGFRVNAQRLDNLLWARGQNPKMKAEPRHRTRCPYY